MNLRTLGNSAIKLSPLGLGCWQFSKHTGFAGKFWPTLSDDEVNEIVKESHLGGINWFDTAELYGWGKSEEALSNALKENQLSGDQAIVATKWWPAFRKANSIKTTIDDRLMYLDDYSITLHQVHMPFGLSSVEKEMNAMADLVEAGKIKHIGVSNFSKSKMLRAAEALDKRGLKLSSNQMEYSLLNRKIESNGVMEAAKELGVSIIAYSPLAQGLVSGKFHADPTLIKSRTGWRKYRKQFSRAGMSNSLPVINELKKISNNYQVTPSQVALNWLIHFHGDTVFAIPGATRVKHAKDNAVAMKFKLNDAELDALDLVSRKFMN